MMLVTCRRQADALLGQPAAERLAGQAVLGCAPPVGIALPGQTRTLSKTASTTTTR